MDPVMGSKRRSAGTMTSPRGSGSDPAPAEPRLIPWLAFALATFAAVAYGPTLNLPFMGDDYVFLDKTRAASFWDLWSLKNTDFGWYRPWSRELHFWLLQRVAGLHEIPFRLSSLLLWIIALCLYAAILRRLASARVAALATLGVASLSLWGTPLLWISGSQDLWMLCFALASLLVFISGRRWWALLLFGLALLSKETSAVLPAILCGYLVFIERRTIAEAFRRTAPYWALALAWFLAHPTLHSRLMPGASQNAETEHRPALVVILLKTLLSTLNLDLLPRPQELRWEEVLRVLLVAATLVVATVIALRAQSLEPLQSDAHGQRPLFRLALVWMAAGWFPLMLPSISWHAYYGCLGALGAWVALALWLQRHGRIAVTLIAILSVLHGAQANTRTWDWGNEWYQRRAGNMQNAIRESLYRLHPTLSPYSRVFFGHIPNNIGLVAGQSPAIRIWYRDPTLRADFYSAYVPRTASEPNGDDFFFHFDSLAGLVEVKGGAEDVRADIASDPNWEGNHEALAMLFLRSGDVPRAETEFEKLSLLGRRPDAAVYAAVCREVMGDSVGAQLLLTTARTRTGLSPALLAQWADRLRETMPHR
jgi:hypothetical protein